MIARRTFLCAISSFLAANASTSLHAAPDATESWAQRLLAAAEAQVGVTTLYSAAYVRMPYPDGDVPRDRGVIKLRPYSDAVRGSYAECNRIARAARQSGLHADGNNVVINDGKAAFQSVLHIHLHVLPRQSGDKLSFAKGMLLRRDPDREESGRLLREALAQLDSAQQD